MKLPLLALLCAAAGAYCQSTAPPRIDPGRLFQLPDRYVHAPDGSQWPTVAGKLHMPLPKPQTVLEVPAARPVNPRVDPKIIVRPPWPKKDPSKGQDVSKLYPTLKYLPVRHDQSGLK